MSGPRVEHWQRVYSTREPTDLSWFQRVPAVSLELISRAGVAPERPVLDVGGGASGLVDELLARGRSDVTVLDVSHAALDVVRRRLGGGAGARLVAADVTTWSPTREHALWHDRAVFHFLTAHDDRAAYRATLARALAPDGVVIVATFAEDGPERCSGLPVRCYDEASLAREFAGVLRPVASRRETHVTPSGAQQRFVWVSFVRDRLPAP